MPSPTPTPTPLDVVRSVAQCLLEKGALATLSSLSTMSKGVYLALVPGLYANLLVNGRKSDALFDLDEWDLETAFQSCTLDNDQVFFSPRNPSRRTWVLSQVKTLKIELYPSASTSLRFLSTVKTPRSSASGMPERPLLLPRLETVSLSPTAVDTLRTFVPDDWDRPHSPPFLEALTGCSSPAHLCISFRVVCSDDWEEHREMTTPGAYQLISRLNQLRTDGWTSLRTFTVHDIVHQVLPSLAGCTNIYHFSPHIAPEVRQYGQAHHPLTPVTPYALNKLDPGRVSRHRDGKAGCGMPGPQWNFRSWQINSAIKNLFPSGTNSRQALEGTKWQFVNISGHVLKKVKRDDDDETGVGADEVGGLVEGLVKSSLPQDLPAREGFSEDLVGEVFDAITYRDGLDQCQACGRGDWSAATISSLRDLKVDERRMPMATHFSQPPRHAATAVIRKKVRITTSPWGRPVDTNYLYQ